MQHAHTLIAAGLMSPKDWISLAIDIEQFRKQETGTQQAPGDFLEQWLSTPGECHPEASSAAAPSPRKAAKPTAKKVTKRTAAK